MANDPSLAGKVTAAQPAVRGELLTQEQGWFELQPIEKKLIGYSFTLGILLLAIFAGVFGLFK